MKKTIYLSSALVILILGSCATPNEVTNGRFLQKRKYTSGFNINTNGKYKGSGDEEVAKKMKTEKETKSVDESNYYSSTSASSDNSYDEHAAIESKKESTKIELTYERSKSEQPSSGENNPSNNIASKQQSDFVHERPLHLKNAKTLKKDMNSNRGADDMFILAVIVAILIPPGGVAIPTNIDWVKGLICLLLTILFFLPGMIYALLVVFDVI